MNGDTGVLCVVQARAGSSRLPGKVLMDLGGQPMLGFMLRRLSALRDVEVVVATSVEPADDAVEACALAVGVPVVRGDERDVLGRFALALERHPADHVVRLTADCPLIDPALVDDVVARHLRTGADYTSNTIIRTFPDGLDVEVLTADALRAAVDEATDPAEREHVTPFVYRRPRRFRLGAVLAPARWGHLRWTVDRAEDLDRVRAMVGQRRASTDADASWEALLSSLLPADRAPLSDGYEPAVPGEVPKGAGALDDPAAPVLVRRVGGVMAGWVHLAVGDAGDGGRASAPTVVTGTIAADEPDLVALAAGSLQITGALVAG